MKRKLFFSLLAIILFASRLSAQVGPPKKAVPPPVALRQVSGIVLDSTEVPIRGANITLTSKTDTLKTSTNEDGIFFFPVVKSWEFALTVSTLGYRNFVKIGKYNDATARLTMDPIVMGKTQHLLKEVVITGKQSITYKTDTVEYKATDYIVREGAGVDELLKKMEGMEIAKDGSLTYNGAEVDKARLNGKDFLGGKGNVATVTRLLPADIVEKIQIVDDYGDQAARSGIKEGDPKKLLNITTKADRSLGYIARMSGGAGNDDRYEGNLTGVRINANKNITLAGAINNTVNGVASTSGGVSGIIPSSGPSGPGGFSGTGGNTKRETGAFSYSDQLGPKTEMTMNYSYSLIDASSMNLSLGQDISTRGTTYTSNDNSSLNSTKIHNLNLSISSNIDSANFIRINPTFSYGSTLSNIDTKTFLTGLIHQDQTGLNSNKDQTPSFGLTALYQHVFFATAKRATRKNFTLMLSASNRNSEMERGQNGHLINYDTLIVNQIVKDSLINRIVERRNLVKNYRTNMTFSNPISANSFLQFTGEINYNGYNNRTVTSNVVSPAINTAIDSLGNLFKYSFTQARMAMSYRYKKNKSEITAGATAVPTILSGTNTTLGTEVQRTRFNILPVLRYSYSWTAQRYASLNYSGTVAEPAFDQIQPVRDVSNPQYPVIGNPDLKASLNHSLNAAYGTYAPNTRFGMTFNLTGTYYSNRVVSNTIQVRQEYQSLRFERHFLNVNGTYQMQGNYTISKQAADRKYSISLSGSINNVHNIGFSNNSKNIASQWIFVQKLSPKINPTQNFELSPTISYTYSQVNNSLSKAIDSKINILSFQLDGRTHFMKSWLVGYNASKSIIHGLDAGLANDPLIVNPYLEKEFTKRKTIKLRVQAFDIFNENKFINRSITETSITDTRSNALSRYVMVNLSASLQRFKGTPKRNGEPMLRHGDGSFIYR